MQAADVWCAVECRSAGCREAVGCGVRDGCGIKLWAGGFSGVWAGC